MEFIKATQTHLVETGWGYRKHLFHSVKQSFRLIVIALKSIVHGFFPWLYASSGPLGIYQVYKEIRRHHHVQKIFIAHDEETEIKDDVT